MIAKLEFLPNLPEPGSPVIKLTKSRNGKTGTATFVFIRPLFFSVETTDYCPTEGLTLWLDSKRIQTRDVQVYFEKGKPFLVKAIFIFKNTEEWFFFLSFMKNYSQEMGLSFSEKIDLSNEKE